MVEARVMVLVAGVVVVVVVAVLVAVVVVLIVGGGGGESKLLKYVNSISKSHTHLHHLHHQHYAENAAFNALLPVSRRRLRRTYLQRLKWTHHIKNEAMHRKVMTTLRRFIEEDDMVFDEATKWAVAKRKFLLNILMKTKLLPDDDEEEESKFRIL